MEKNYYRRCRQPIPSVAHDFRVTANIVARSRRRLYPLASRLFQKAAVIAFTPAAYITLQSGGLTEKLVLLGQGRTRPNLLSNGAGVMGMAAGAYGAYQGYGALARLLIRQLSV